MKTNFSVLVLIALTFLISSKSGISQVQNENTMQSGMDVSGVWRQVAPGMAGSNRAIYTDAVDPLKIWVTPDMGNDYLTIDGGKHWESIVPPNGVWTQRNTLSDECVVSDPKNNNIVLSLNQKDIYLSTDGGRNFDKISTYTAGQEPNSVWYTAVPHPVEAGTWFVANGLDNKYLRIGANPNPLTSIDVNSPKVWKITNITQDIRVIEAVSGIGMDASTAVFDIFCHPNTQLYPEMLFAATSTGVYRKNNLSASWNKILEGCTKADYQWDGHVLTVYALQQTSYEVSGNSLLSNGGVYKTTSSETVASGDGWINKTSGLQVDLTQLDINKSYFKSMVKSWFDYTNGEENSVNTPSSFLQDYSDILCDPSDANKVYLSVWGGTILKPITSCVWSTNNGGESWFAAFRIGTGYAKDSYWSTTQPGRTNRNVELGVADHKLPDFVSYENRGVRSMAIGSDGTVYASAVKGYHTYKYEVNADYWASIDNTQEGDAFYGHGNNDTGAFAVIPDIHHPGEMFVLQYEASAFKSTTLVHPDFPGIVGVKRIPALVDIGPTWAPGQPLNTPVTLACHPTKPDVFYYMSARTGEVRKCAADSDTHTVMGEPIEVPDVLNVSQMKCIYWSDLRIAADGKTMYAIAEIIDTDNRPMGQTKIYNPEPRKGIYKSTTEGATWTCENSGLPVTAGGRDASGSVVGSNSASVKALVMDPANEACLYAAVKRYRAPSGSAGWVNGGLYRTNNGSTSWSEVSIPDGIKSLWDVWLHVSDGKAVKIYIAGGGEGSVADWGAGGVWEADYKANGDYQASDWKKIFDHPFTSHVRTSPDNHNCILVASRETSSNGNEDAGTFYTLTGGGMNYKESWTKFNEGRGSMMIGDISFDNGNANRVWCAVESSGVYTALLESSLIGDIDRIEVSPKAVDLKVNEKLQLDYKVFPLGVTPVKPIWKSLDEETVKLSETGEITLLQQGTANVVVQIVVDQTSYSDTCRVSTQIANSVNAIEQDWFKLYPNPVTEGRIHIGNAEPDAGYFIFNHEGVKVSQGKLIDQSIDVSRLEKGVYLLRINQQTAQFLLM